MTTYTDFVSYDCYGLQYSDEYPLSMQLLFHCLIGLILQTKTPCVQIRIHSWLIDTIYSTVAHQNIFIFHCSLSLYSVSITDRFLFYSTILIFTINSAVILINELLLFSRYFGSLIRTCYFIVQTVMT